jgi:predicted nucleic acid-binding protein
VGATTKLLDLWQEGAVEFVVCPRLLDEVGRTLLDARVRVKYGLDKADIAEFVERLRKDGVGFDDPVDPPRVVPSDPNDDYLIALALESGADALITRDQHFDDVSVSGLRIIAPGRFLRHFRES